jgi:hypothetical protein
MSYSNARINGIPVMEWLKGSIDLAFMGNGVSIGGEELEELLDIVERKSAVTSPWIPVSERLPRNGQKVLIYGKVEGFRFMARGLVNTVGNGFPVDTTHWMKPEKPQ